MMNKEKWKEAMPFPLTVLYVEDNEEARELTRFFLESYFTEVLSVEDGEKALEVFLETPEIDIVITDLSLPGFDGFEMLRRMRRRREELSIVIFSAYAETHQLFQAIDLAVDGYLLKPFDPERFEKVMMCVVRRLLKRRDRQHYLEALENRIEELEEECRRLQGSGCKDS